MPSTTGCELVTLSDVHTVDHVPAGQAWSRTEIVTGLRLVDKARVDTDDDSIAATIRRSTT